MNESSRRQLFNLVKSVWHNVGVTIVGLGVAFAGKLLDSFFGINEFGTFLTTSAGWLLVGLGFLLRIWATFYFYERDMKVISLVPQKKLITSGPYRFSRNPLYLGGNVFIFFGAALLLGTPTGVLLTVLNIVIVDVFIRREERQLAKDFGDQWEQYKKQVRRWL